MGTFIWIRLVQKVRLWNYVGPEYWIKLIRERERERALDSWMNKGINGNLLIKSGFNALTDCLELRMLPSS